MAAAPLKVLVLTKGHPFERDPFSAMLDSLPDIDCTLVEQPAAQAFFAPDLAAEWDVFLLYDMPGVQFGRPGGPQFPAPSEALKQNIEAFTQEGFGIVALHHAIAGWPAWPQYADILGGRFLYLPGELRGTSRQDSGYRHKVTHTISPAGNHPVTSGVTPFEITDELYLFEVFAEDVTPLVTSNYLFTDENFYSATHAVRDGRMFSNDGWQHDTGSATVGWVKDHNRSPVVYLQCGDDPEAYANSGFQQLLTNALKWTAKEASARRS